MLSLSAALLSHSSPNTALTPNQAAEAGRSREPSGANWVDHPESDVLARGDGQPAAKSHFDLPAEGSVGSGWKSQDVKPLASLHAKQAATTSVGDPTYICTDISFAGASPDVVANLGRAANCCNYCADGSKMCCPSVNEAGAPVRLPPYPCIVAASAPSQLRLPVGRSYWNSIMHMTRATRSTCASTKQRKILIFQVSGLTMSRPQSTIPQSR